MTKDGENGPGMTGSVRVLVDCTEGRENLVIPKPLKGSEKVVKKQGAFKKLKQYNMIVV